MLHFLPPSTCQRLSSSIVLAAFASSIRMAGVLEAAAANLCFCQRFATRRLMEHGQSMRDQSNLLGAVSWAARKSEPGIQTPGKCPAWR